MGKAEAIVHQYSEDLAPIATARAQVSWVETKYPIQNNSYQFDTPICFSRLYLTVCHIQIQIMLRIYTVV